MILFVLKSSACLAIFMIFYKIFLEKENMHKFKRFFLLGAILISIVIPFITFTEYIEVSNPQNTIPLLTPPELSNTGLINTLTIEDYILVILWSLYLIGVAIFTYRFSRNLKDIILKIKTNPKHKHLSFTNVLLQDLIAPHTFLNYIFVNKTKYENKLIPNEVLLHEQTHAQQKHAIDILIIELLQIVFWFNPLIYLIKKDIKLNHEFLADKAVLDKGINTSHYKKTLLAFSSNAKEPQLANAINYSSIKKRFTVMKTQTSKTAFYFRSLIILPLLAILLYGFSNKKTIEREITSFKKSETPQELLPQERESLQININEEPERFSNLKINYPDNLQQTNELNSKSSIGNQDYDSQLNVSVYEDEKRVQQEATKEQLAEYNKLAKKYNAQPENKRIIKLKDVKRLEYLYSLMSKSQKASAEPFPNYPPPPAPTSIKVVKVKEVPAPSKKSIKRKLDNGEIIEIREVPPPPPPTPAIKVKAKPSKSVLMAQKKYKKEAEVYGKAVSDYLKGKETNTIHLKEMYKRTMNLYNNYAELAKKEDILISPPPPPAPKKANN